MAFCIQVSDLHHRYQGVQALSGLDLEIPQGCVTGFLGPNGAGKSTTIRILLGLMRPQSGRCEVLGLPAGHPEALRRIGALVEAPSLYPHLSGRDNVRITQLMKDAPASDVDRVLEVVGLQGAAHRMAQTYSLGMKQRLGLALALLGSPELLILDEPTNGLDPAGIQEMRTLLRSLPQALGCTVFVSSHLLSEVEQMASHVVVVHQGTTRFQGSLADLGHGTVGRLRLRTSQPEATVSLLQREGLRSTPGEGGLVVELDPAEAPRLARLVVEGGQDLLELVPLQASLEDRFLELTGSR